MASETEFQVLETSVPAEGVQTYSVEIEALADRLAAQSAASPAEVAALWQAVQRDADALSASLDRAITQAHPAKA